MLTKIKLLLGITSADKDSLLQVLIDNATEFALNYTHRDTAEELTSAIQSMVIYDYNRLGTQGLNSESYSGITFNYQEDYPDSIYKSLKAKRKVMVVE